LIRLRAVDKCILGWVSLVDQFRIEIMADIWIHRHISADS